MRASTGVYRRNYKLEGSHGPEQNRTPRARVEISVLVLAGPDRLWREMARPAYLVSGVGARAGSGVLNIDRLRAHPRRRPRSSDGVSGAGRGSRARRLQCLCSFAGRASTGGGGFTRVQNRTPRAHVEISVLVLAGPDRLWREMARQLSGVLEKNRRGKIPLVASGIDQRRA